MRTSSTRNSMAILCVTYWKKTTPALVVLWWLLLLTSCTIQAPSLTQFVSMHLQFLMHHFHHRHPNTLRCFSNCWLTSSRYRRWQASLPSRTTAIRFAADSTIALPHHSHPSPKQSIFEAENIAGDVSGFIFCNCLLLGWWDLLPSHWGDLDHTSLEEVPPRRGYERLPSAGEEELTIQ